MEAFSPKNSFYKLSHPHNLRFRSAHSTCRRSALAILTSLGFVYHFIKNTKTKFVNSVFTLRLHSPSLALDQRSLAGHVSSLARYLRSFAGRIHRVLGHLSKVFGRITNVIGHPTNVIGHLSSLAGHVSSYAGHLTNMIGRKYSEAYHQRNVLSNVSGELSNKDCFPSFIHKIFKNVNLKTAIYNKLVWSLKQISSFQLKNKGAIFLFT